MEDLLKAIEAFPKGRILVVGDIMMDQFIWGEVSRISPEAPVPVVQVRDETFL
jgi:D-beta-D-heptose 7-phosphate kinase/D-beta-D-heptose 1-phosphate adenosyltransferase